MVAMQTQNWDKYLAFKCKMLPWIAAYDSLHQTRYLCLHWSEINLSLIINTKVVKNIKKVKELLKSVANM